MTELKFDELLKRLLGRIGEELGVKISPFYFGNYQSKKYCSGDLTYAVNSTFEVKLCRWLNSMSGNCEVVPKPPLMMTPEEDAKFEDVLRQAVRKLLQQESPSDA